MKNKISLIIVAIFLLLLLTACSENTVVPTVEVTRIVPETVVVTEIVERIVTTTPQAEPTRTVAEATETPTVSSIPQEAVEFNAWCLPDGVQNPASYVDENASLPEIGEPWTYKNGMLEIHNIPKTNCTFVYKFNQAVQPGTQLEIYDLNQSEPWLNQTLRQAAGDPSIGFATLDHTFIIDPPGWDFAYDFVVRGANGTEIRSDRVIIHRWDPGVCWDGVKPEYPSLRCREQQDQHPWDYGYTPPPPENDNE